MNLSQEDPHLLSFRAMRRLIGILGMLLPWSCWAVNALINRLNLLNNEQIALLADGKHYEAHGNLKKSISHFYYTASAPLFIGIIITVAIFLFCYKGYEYRAERDKTRWLSDNSVCTMAAFFALGIVVFPTGQDSYISDSLFIYTVTTSVGNIHYIFTALFFSAIAVLCLVNFRRKEKKEDFGKDKFDLLYRVCGWTILGSEIFIFVYHKFLGAIVKFGWPVTFIFETLALTAFGVAWLIKGRSDEIVKDIIGKKKKNKRYNYKNRQSL